MAKNMNIISIAVLPLNNDERICNLFQLFLGLCFLLRLNLFFL